ncbi:hypothetical protein NR402_03755 [Acidithiobacillus ferrooxidans]|jgi:hypothetical protein|uniref:hypothetical protein n=1 Tax=Acidithiobacillus ferrooxidans TaxID=920 RepID=UPI0013D49CA2|nr:hypothetical protein [Acidithiobacillus ferrooxidans]MCR2829398.1 hypothetical protein [Acidithiobacillus ferrooxidans]
MGMMDYIIGKNVGREEARNSQDSGAAHRAEMDAIQSQGTADQAQNTALAIAIALKQTREELGIMRKRFYREREKRFSWQRTAELRKLSLVERGATLADIKADQDRIVMLPGVQDDLVARLEKESAKIDAEFEASPEAGGTDQSTRQMN